MLLVNVYIGGGTFINAKIMNSSKILYDVGEGIVVEKSIDDAIGKVDSRIKELQQTEEKISTMAQQIQNELNNTSNIVETLLANK